MDHNRIVYLVFEDHRAQDAVVEWFNAAAELVDITGRNGSHLHIYFYKFEFLVPDRIQYYIPVNTGSSHKDIFEALDCCIDHRRQFHPDALVYKIVCLTRYKRFQFASLTSRISLHITSIGSMFRVKARLPFGSIYKTIENYGDVRDLGKRGRNGEITVYEALSNMVTNNNNHLNEVEIVSFTSIRSTQKSKKRKKKEEKKPIIGKEPGFYTVDDMTCHICSTYEKDGVFPCGHVYGCLECSREWIKKSATCPICNAYADKVNKFYITRSDY